MFCSNCGNKLTAGEKFCSVCGARVGTGTEQPVKRDREEPAGRFGTERKAPVRDFTSAVDSMEPSAPRKAPENVSFDWSSVVDESHKKRTPDIRSPWDSKGLDENEREVTANAVNSGRDKSLERTVFEDARNTPPDRNRTMSFIDILKQEREEKALKAEETADRNVAARPLQDDFSAFDHADAAKDFGYSETVLPENDREYTRGYTDLKRNITEELDRGDADKENHAPADFDSQLAYIRARKEAKAKESRVMDAPEPPQSFVDMDRKSFEEPEEGFAGRVSREAEEAAKAPQQEKGGRSSLEAELADILGSDSGLRGTGRHAEPEEEPKVAEEKDVDLFDDENAEDSYLNYSPRGRSARSEDLSDNEFAADEKYDEYDEYDEYEESAGEAPAEAEEHSAPAADEKASATAEIEELQRRLAELLGQKEEEPEKVPARETATAEELTGEPSHDEYPGDDDFFNADLHDNETDDNEESFEYEEEEDAYLTPEAESAEPVEDAEDFAFGAEEGVEDFSLDELNDIEDTAAAVQPEAEAAVPEAEPAVPETEPAAEEADENEFSGSDDGELDLESELSALGFDVSEPSVIMDQPSKEEDMLFTDDTLSDADDVFEGEEAENDAMSIDELENDLFGESAGGDDLEATRKIEKFYTLYRKNEEFQQLLDAEYDKLKNGEDFDLMDGQLEDFVENSEIPEETAPEAEATQEIPAADMAQAASAAPAAQKPQQAEPVQQTVTEPVPVMQKPQPVPQAAEKAAPVADTEGEGEGKGGVLTVLAIIVAVLLVCLLAVILILSFAPNSGIADQLNQVIDNFSKLIAANDGDTSFLL